MTEEPRTEPVDENRQPPIEDEPEARFSALKDQVLKSKNQTGTISEALGRRNFMLALGWIAIIAIGVIGEQVKTRWEYATRNSKTRELKPNEQREITKASGLRYVDLQVGAGETPRTGDLCLIQYTLTLADGTKVISSYDQGQKAIAFPLGASTGQPDVIPPGLDQGISDMKQGGKRRLTVPPELGFGDQPRFFPQVTVAPGSTLIYEVELVKVSTSPA
ncbi:MAG: hypothetical protein F6K19_14725 [Cyanothece sp. SIO1E1]|nr:hypothetical protein [Cyanothece sp. SIO1E1]